MIVYKAFGKIIKRYIGLIFMYLGIFAGIILINIANLQDNDVTSFESTSVSVAVINHDAGEIGKALEQYLEQETNLVTVSENREAMQDALFYRAAEYILVIPENFTSALLAGEEPKLERVQVADSYSGYYVDSMVDKYLNLIRIYEAAGDYSTETVIKNVESDLNNTVTVELATGTEEESNGAQHMASAFNCAAYVILALGMTLVGILVAAFHDADRYRRILVSPLPPEKLAKAQLIANGILMIAIVTVNYGILWIMMSKYINLYNGIIFYINMLLMGAVSLLLGYILALFVKSSSGRGGAINAISLGMSFLCGVFVPLSYLGEGVKKMGQCLPAYWFVKVNEKAAGMTGFAKDALGDIGKWMGVECLFIIGLTMVALILIKKRRNFESF